MEEKIAKPKVEISKEHLLKIREMYWSDDAEDKDIAYKWLCSAIGKDDADANILIMTFFIDEDDQEYNLSKDTYWTLDFRTYRTSFGKDYRYQVLMLAYLKGKEIVNRCGDYSRYQVGNNDPKWDLLDAAYGKLTDQGHEFYKELYGRAVTPARQRSKK